MSVRTILRHLKKSMVFQNHRFPLSNFDNFDKYETPVINKIMPIPEDNYDGRHTVTMLPGTGIGPELTTYVKEVFNYADVPVDFENIKIDLTKRDSHDLDNAITSIQRNAVALKGNIETRSSEIDIFPRNAFLRNALDLYVNILHCASYPGVNSRQKNIDIVIIRQNTGGEYSMLEHEIIRGSCETLKIMTISECERIARYAFKYAVKNGRKKVTTIHKANIMKKTDGLFLDVSREVAKDYPDIKHNDLIIDNCCMQLVKNLHQFDVLLTTNLYGSIVSNVVCGLLGGAGLFASKDHGDYYTVFEPGTRNIGSDIAGKNIANPIAMLNAAVHMLHHLGYKYHAIIIQNAINMTINEGVHTHDLGGSATSKEVIDNILKHIKIAV